MEIKGMKILIAGASGLVGSALVAKLKTDGAEVTALGVGGQDWGD